MSQKSDYVHKSIEGVVVTSEERNLHDGRPVATARIRDRAGGIWVCTFWDALAVSFRLNCKEGSAVYVDGGLRDGNCISVKFFDGKKDAPGDKTSGIISEQDEFEEFCEAIDYSQTKIKLVWSDRRGVKTYRFEHKRDYVQVNGVWEKKIEYCMRVMGPGTCLDYLKHFDPIAKAAPTMLPTNAIRDTITRMVAKCAEHTRDNVTFFEANA